jgi:hypothetical protein
MNKTIQPQLTLVVQMKSSPSWLCSQSRTSSIDLEKSRLSLIKKGQSSIIQMETIWHFSLCMRLGRLRDARVHGASRTSCKQGHSRGHRMWGNNSLRLWIGLNFHYLHVAYSRIRITLGLGNLYALGSLLMRDEKTLKKGIEQWLIINRFIYIQVHHCSIKTPSGLYIMNSFLQPKSTCVRFVQ